MKLVFLSAVIVGMSSCLKTRSELGENYQSQVYSKKQADNQKSQSQEPSESIAKVDEKDELIRTLNGRVESLENQINLLQKEKQENTDGQKVQLLQDSLVKMEAQLAKLESDMVTHSSDSKVTVDAKGSDAKVIVPVGAKTETHTGGKSSAKNNFETAQDFFAHKDFKNAILEYQKFVDTNKKSKLVPEAKYKIGLSFESMGLKDEAQSFYEEVAAQHGSTEFGKKAKQKVTKTKK